MSGTDTLPLAGIRVLDLSRVLAGPWATQVLGDLGAEVLKIERPGAGDDTRAWGPPWLEGDDPVSAYYLACNRNKHSLAVDIAQPEGAALIRRLVRECDILVENFKVGGLARYGLDHQTLRSDNPRLIYCSITGFGQDGPYAERGGYDFLVQGLGGLMSVTGPATGEPTKVGVPVIDLFTGLYAVISIQAALRHRDKTGEGQHIDCSLLDTSVAILANQGMNHLIGGIIPKPMGNGHPNVVPYRPFPTADGHVIITVGNDGQFRVLCKMLGRQDLGADPDFATNTLRVMNRERLEHALEHETSRYTSAALLALMQQFGVAGGPINRLDQVFADPQVQARGMVETHARKDQTDLSMVRFPARLSSSPATIRKLPPGLGQDTLATLQRLGVPQHEIETLLQQGILADGQPDNAKGVSA